MGNHGKGFKSLGCGKRRLQNRQSILMGLNYKRHHAWVETRHQNVDISQPSVN